jgi:phage FluMu gp28-like protein
MGNAKIITHDGLFMAGQQKWIADNSRLKMMEKARQIGISWSTAYAADERTAKLGSKHDQWVSSRDDLQARLFIEDCKMWSKVINIAAKDLGEIIVDEKTKATAFTLEFSNGRRIHSLSSNADAQAGKRGGRILDEFALHPDPRKLWSIAYPGITWGGSMEIISTHRGSHNFFNQLIREVKENGNPKNISLHRITLQDALEQGFLYKLQQALHDDDERQAMDEAAYFDFIKSGCADNESFEQEYMCNPADDDSAFLEYDLIASCEYQNSEEWEYRLSDLKSAKGTLYMGIDIGRKGDLTVIWILEKLGDVLYTRMIIELQNMRKSDQEAVFYPLIPYMQRVCLDYTGLGIGWGDDAQDKFGQYKIECVTFTNASKESMAYALRGSFEDKKVRIPFNPKVRADLRAVMKTTTSSGNIRFAAERTKDGHSDRFWALALGICAAGNGAVSSAGETIDDDIDTYRPESMSRRRLSLTNYGI